MSLTTDQQDRLEDASNHLSCLAMMLAGSAAEAFHDTPEDVQAGVLALLASLAVEVQSLVRLANAAQAEGGAA